MFGSDSEFEAQFLGLIHRRNAYFQAIAVRIVNSGADAEDAVQCALIKAWEKRYSFRGESTLSGWVARIVIAESYNLVRRRLREKQHLEHFEPEDGGGETGRQMEMLDSVIAGLPDLYRETVHVAVLSGLGGESAARELGCSPNTLYQRIHKAKELIKAGFAQYEAD